MRPRDWGKMTRDQVKDWEYEGNLRRRRMPMVRRRENCRLAARASRRGRSSSTREPYTEHGQAADEWAEIATGDNGREGCRRYIAPLQMVAGSPRYPVHDAQPVSTLATASPIRCVYCKRPSGFRVTISLKKCPKIKILICNETSPVLANVGYRPII